MRNKILVALIPVIASIIARQIQARLRAKEAGTKAAAA